ncbi:hypothetical protein MPSEU_000660400 [Mayamaea pseudoterrestris]|nr:hypothetical protein MPSEU_000660400 [Mayamaea pseudoterrestris]
MIQNPYLKSLKRARTAETSEAAPSSDRSRDIQQHQLQNIQPIVHQQPVCSQQPHANANNVLNESFDADIDWDAAIVLADQVEQPSEPMNEAAIDEPASVASAATVAPKIQSASSLDTKNKTSCIDSHVVGAAVIQLQQHTVLSQQTAVASLRPSNWNQNKSDQPPLNIQQKSIEQNDTHYPPIIQSLPPLLRFQYPIPPPPDDDDKHGNDEQESIRKRLVRHATLSEPLDNGWTLFSHQKQAILRGLTRRRMILALDMGLGKTLTGCVWARAFQRTFDRVKVIVICPVSLKAEWKRTAEQATSLKVQDMEPCDWTTTDVCIASWAKVPSFTVAPKDDSAVTKYVVLADEAHSMQSMAASRTQDALKLMLNTSKASRCKCVGVLLLTGTPMKNGKPANLFPLLKAVQHPFGNHQREYETHFCAGFQQHFGARAVWNASGASNLVQLRELVASHVLHITKDSVMKELPPKTRVIHNVPVSAKCQLQHTHALKDLARVYHATPAPGSTVDKNDSILGAVQKVRLVGSFAKVDATVQLAQQTLEKEPAVVIFTSFVDVAKLVHKRLKESGWDGHLLTGETPPKKRQGLVDDFQNGLAPVFVVTFGAGGVGLTLTAACTVILLDRPWTPGDALQAEDRVRRIGQTEAVTSIWVSAFDLDRQIDALLEQKNNTSNVVLAAQENESETNGSTDAPRISIFQMLRSILPGPGGGGGDSHTSVSEYDGFRQTSLLEFSQKPSEPGS